VSGERAWSVEAGVVVLIAFLIQTQQHRLVPLYLIGAALSDLSSTLTNIKLSLHGRFTTNP
jgi:hypothetical protein